MSRLLLIAAALAGLVTAACSQPASAPAKASPAAAVSTSDAAPADKPAADPRALRARANSAYQAGDYPACQASYGELVVSSPTSASADDHYNAACCAALAGDAEAAFGYLDGALAAGFRAADHMQRDTDLTSLHDDARWAPAVERAGTNLRAYEASVNAELARIYREDQADRSGPYESIDWSVVGPRDQARRERVREILAEGGAKVSDDYLHAAMVFQHGEGDDYQLAHELAVKAVELDPGNDTARWLAAAAKDRHLMNQGKPQLYGTQFRKIDGRWQLYQVDPSITDEERARWNVPPLAEARKRAEMMNQQP